MSHPPKRPSDVVLNEWLDEVKALRLEIDRPLERPDLQPYGHALAEGLAAIHRARQRDLPDLVLEEVVWLAQSVAAATRTNCDSEWAMLNLEAQIASWQDYAKTLEDMLTKISKKDAARLAGLEAARAQRKAKLDAKLAELRPEFERLQKNGHSARRAAELLSKRAGGKKADTLRKQLRNRPPS
jgi:hypothetical protein